MGLTLGQGTTKFQIPGTAEAGCTLLKIMIIVSMAMLLIQIQFEQKISKPTGVKKLVLEATSCYRLISCTQMKF